MISRFDFHRGLLLAIASQRRSFVADGPNFANAYVDAAQGAEIEDSRWTQIDPMFGHCQHANEMVLQGMFDRMLTLLSPDLTTARFTISAGDALRELQETFPDRVEWYMSLGVRFSEKAK